MSNKEKYYFKIRKYFFKEKKKTQSKLMVIKGSEALYNSVQTIWLATSVGINSMLNKLVVS